MTAEADWPETLAAALASRLVHDLAGPASAIASGLELQAHPAHRDMREEALALASTSTGDLLALLGFCREAYCAVGEVRDVKGLEALALTQFKSKRASLEWLIDAPPPAGPATQSLLILIQIAAGGLGRGGMARAAARRDAEGAVEIVVNGEGPGARLSPEAVEGLAGGPAPRALPGRWAPARYLRSIVLSAGGEVRTEIRGDSFVLTARLPHT